MAKWEKLQFSSWKTETIRKNKVLTKKEKTERRTKWTEKPKNRNKKLTGWVQQQDGDSKGTGQ